MKVLISAEEIAEKVKQYGKIISKDYAGKPLLILGVLRGSFIFIADLVREIDIETDIEIGFIRASSYNNGTVSSGVVEVEFNVKQDISNYHILLIEDILDTGNTLTAVVKETLKQNPLSVKTCTLLDKPSRRTAPFEADYALFEIEDKFVVGYGLDHAEKFRNLSYIAEI